MVFLMTMIGCVIHQTLTCSAPQARTAPRTAYICLPQISDLFACRTLKQASRLIYHVSTGFHFLCVKGAGEEPRSRRSLMSFIDNVSSLHVDQLRT